MYPAIFFILVALTVAMAAWGASGFVLAWLQGEKRRLHQRLGGLGGPRRGGGAEKSVVLHQTEVGSLSGRLASRALFTSLTRKLAAVWPSMPVGKFLAVCGAIGLSLFCLVAVLADSALVGAAAGAAAGWLPVMLVSRKANARQQQFGMQLPEALDFLARILRAGHSLSTGLQMMGSELPDPLAGEFRRCYDQHSLGQPLEDSLKEMSTRVESTDFAFFVTAVLIQRQTGGDLSTVLTNISNMVRGRIRLGQYVGAKTAEGRLTGYILVAFPAIMFFITYALNPKYGSEMTHSSTGLKLLGTAVGLQILGLVAIRKITTVKV